jgi:hypothetical protein
MLSITATHVIMKITDKCKHPPLTIGMINPPIWHRCLVCVARVDNVAKVLKKQLLNALEIRVERFLGPRYLSGNFVNILNFL